MRTHAVTGEAPPVRYDRDERAVMGAYLSPPGIAELDHPTMPTRQVDKTGLIADRANQYAVPLAYQRAVVGVLEEDGQLVICALDSGEVLARHPLACGKGEVFKNTHHYPIFNRFCRPSSPEPRFSGAMARAAQAGSGT